MRFPKRNFASGTCLVRSISDQVRRLAAELIPNKHVEVIVYCAGPQSNASDTAAIEFNRMGYSNVRRYIGGKQDWL